MKLDTATFVFARLLGSAVEVTFLDAKSQIEVTVDGETTHLDNEARRFKPCVTHCKQLVEFLKGRDAKNLAQRTRRRNVRPLPPQLKVIIPED